MPLGLEPTQLLIIAAVIAVPVIVLAVVLSARSHRRTALRERFGAEYDRTLRSAPNKRAGLKDLEEREQLAQELSLRDASTDEVSGLRRRIAALQYRFMDDPGSALLELRPVVDDALAARDYPAHSDRERALRLLSVEDPEATVALRRLDEVTDDRPRTKAEGPVTLDVQREVFLGVRAALRDVAGVTAGEGDPPAALQAPPPEPLQSGDAPRPAALDVPSGTSSEPWDAPGSGDQRPVEDPYEPEDRYEPDPRSQPAPGPDPYREDPPAGSRRA